MSLQSETPLGTLIELGDVSTISDANEMPFEVSGSAKPKKISWLNIKATLKTYFDTLYTTTAAVATQITTALTGYLTAATAAATYQPLVTWTDISNTSTIIGWSLFTIKEIYTITENKKVTVFFYLTGTSDSTGTSFTVTTNASSGVDSFYGAAQGINNGAAAAAAHRATINANSNLVTLNSNWAGGAYTASGSKSVRGTIIYYTA